MFHGQGGRTRARRVLVYKKAGISILSILSLSLSPCEKRNEPKEESKTKNKGWGIIVSGIFALPPVFFVSIKGNKINPLGQATQTDSSQRTGIQCVCGPESGVAWVYLASFEIAPALGPVSWSGILRRPGPRQPRRSQLLPKGGEGREECRMGIPTSSSRRWQGSLAPGPCSRLPSVTSSSFLAMHG